MGLGKGLKSTGGELFKRTESDDANVHLQQNANVDTPTYADATMQQDAIVEPPKVAEVRKHFVLPEPLAERLRRYCFEQRVKEAPVVREALDQYLGKAGY